MPSHRILVSLLDESHEYQQLQAEEARSAGMRAGVEVEVVYCKSDPMVQMNQIAKAIEAEPTRRPAAVVLQPVMVAGLEALARSALRAGVGWITVDAAFYLESIQREFPGKLVALVTSDNREIGRLQARLVRALLPRGGGVVYVEGPSLGAPTVSRREGFKEAMAGARPAVIKTLTGDWTEPSAEKAMSFWLRVGGKALRPALVCAQNDHMAVGARKAVRALRPEWEDVLFTGCDGLPRGGQRLVREKVLAGTVIQPATTGASVELAARALQGEKVPPTTYLPPRIHPPIEELEHRAGT